MAATATYIVLGLGNTLHSDDGIGPQTIEKLRSDPRMPGEPQVHSHAQTRCLWRHSWRELQTVGD